jgi:hypothetical protein
LRNHKERGRGSIHQEPYKHDFFALFAEAYNSGMMSGGKRVLYADVLADAIVQWAPELAEGPTWKILHGFWSEWTYAWDHAATPSLVRRVVSSEGCELAAPLFAAPAGMLNSRTLVAAPGALPQLATRHGKGQEDRRFRAGQGSRG